MPDQPAIRGIIFDLDGTLVDSALDFEAMRREMGLAARSPLLESIDQLDEPRKSACHQILERHEWAGVECATLMPGVREFLTLLDARSVRQAVLTRNSRAVALATLERLNLRFDPVLAREDAPAKPDPTAIWQICQAWALDRQHVLMLGDFHFDIEAGRRAGVRTVLYTAGREPGDISGWERADLCLRCFREPAELLSWLDVRPC